jgi:DnaJ family protein B protein 4
MNHYRTLGVKKGATPIELKRAFRAAALREHPDHNRDNVEAATRAFQKVTHAFEVLSDAGKRRVYDLTCDDAGDAIEPCGPIRHVRTHVSGAAAAASTSKAFASAMPVAAAAAASSYTYTYTTRPHSASVDKFPTMSSDARKLFATFLKGGVAAVPTPTTPSARLPDVVVHVHVTLEELFLGVTRDVAHEQRTYTLEIARTHRAGTVYRFSRAASGGRADLAFVLVQTPHVRLTRRDDADLLAVHELTLLEALTGAPFHVRGIDNRDVMVNSDAASGVIHDRQCFVLPSHGMHVRIKHATAAEAAAVVHQRGALHVECSIRMPPQGMRFTHAQIEHLHAAFAH